DPYSAQYSGGHGRLHCTARTRRLRKPVLFDVEDRKESVSMGPMDIFYAVFCCRCYVQQEIEEKDAILRNSEQGQEPEQTVWNSSRTSNCATEPECDGELHDFIMMRNQTDKDTEEWEKLNYDIHTLKCARREVSTRWRKILLQLGYQWEVDALLMVSRQGALSDCGNLAVATEMLQTLWAESGLFPAGYSTLDRYLFVMDRLVSLDSADDFVRLAKKKYPKKV
ncbi:hypothetical protein AAFF_G00281440, partial [Aldrovandia affinis]